MAIRLLFFAQCADWVGRKELSLEQSEPIALAQLLLSRKELAPVLEHKGLLRIAVNKDIATFDTEVRDGDEVAIMPPVSGG